MSNGTLTSQLPRSPHKLSWIDCLHIAETAKLQSDLSKTVEWVEHAVILAKLRNVTQDIFNDIKKMHSDSVNFHDSVAIKFGKFTKFDEYPTTTRIDPYNPKVAKEKKSTIKMWHKKFKEFKKNFPMFKDEPRNELQTLDRVAYVDHISEECQNLPSSKYIVHNNTLKCHNLHKNLPNLRLGPVKFEPLSEHPLVGVFHDFMSDSECDKLKEKGRNTMKSTPLTVPKSNVLFYPSR